MIIINQKLLENQIDSVCIQERLPPIVYQFMSNLDTFKYWITQSCFDVLQDHEFI
ncbi:hypothetical protein pb186bvf_012858 [Paramecium bursaria]